jgi:hypothetical protein
MRLLGLILFGSLLAGCGAPFAADSSEEVKQWQGTWKLVSSIYDGEPQIADMQSTTISTSTSNLGRTRTRFKFDASEKHIDVKHHKTPKGYWGGSLTGIYAGFTSGEPCNSFAGGGHDYPCGSDRENHMDGAAKMSKTARSPHSYRPHRCS